MLMERERLLLQSTIEQHGASGPRNDIAPKKGFICNKIGRCFKVFLNTS
jgi:hypothetical protein